MEPLRQILDQHPKAGHSDSELAETVIALLECAAVCTVCADACANEPDDLGRCARTDVDCADVCRATAALLSRQPLVAPELVAQLLGVCESFCERCADECSAHAERHDHCATCAAVCNRCAERCRVMAGRLRTNAES